VNKVENWIIGVASAILGTAALFVAARAGEGVGYYGGIVGFLFCAIFVLYLTKTSFEHD
jgi:hypothetical protein